MTRVWEVTEAYGYDNQMNSFGFSDADKKGTFGHEMGHALSLRDTDELAIMRQGISKSNVPTTVDKNHLKLKWGY